MQSSNIFETAAANRGDISEKQERWLVRKRIELGASRFATYMAILNITVPIPRMTRGQAHKLIGAIARDLEGPQ